MTREEIEKDAIALIRDEKTLWGEMEVRLTDKISFRCKSIYEKARKNYFSIFDDLYDSVTGRKKLFVPMTRDMVETTVKNVDIDTKDIGVRAKAPSYRNLAILARYLLSTSLDKMRFGQLLNRMIRKTGVEGTSVFKKYSDSKKVDVSLLENLNFITDPTCNYLKESSANIETNYLSIEEARKYNEWEKLDSIVGRTSFEKIENLPVQTKIPYVDVTERWGWMPKYFLTMNEADRNNYIEGIIITSNLNSGPVVQLIAENKKQKRPYREFRTKVYDGRWPGIGIGEDIFDLQSYINEVVNTRMNVNRIKHLGLFQIRKGSGITPQMINQLHGVGVVQVSRIGQDIAELRTSDIKPSSYKDEEQGYLWAQRMTGNWQIGRGEALPASQPATTAVLQSQGMSTGFSLQQEELGLCLSEFIEELLLPEMFKIVEDGDIIRITGDPKEFKILEDCAVDTIVNEEVRKYNERNGYWPTMLEIEGLKEKQRSIWRKQGKDRWFKIRKSLFSSENILDSVEVFITSEAFDKIVLARELNNLLMNYSRIPGITLDVDQIVAEIFDLMGLSSERFSKRPEEVPQYMTSSMTAPKSLPNLQQPTEKVAEALTPERTGMALVPSM